MTVDVHALAGEIAALVQPATPALLDAKAAGELLCVPPSWLLDQARANAIPHIKLGRYTRFDAAELTAWRREKATFGPRTGRGPVSQGLRAA